MMCPKKKAISLIHVAELIVFIITLMTCGMSDDFRQLVFCCFCCVSSSLEAPSPIPAASLFEPVITSILYRIYVLLFGCHCTTVLFTYASTIHVKVYTCEALFCVCSSMVPLLNLVHHSFILIHNYTKAGLDYCMYNACLLNVCLFFFFFCPFRRGKGGGNM